MKFLRVSLKTFCRHAVRNSVSPPNLYMNRGIAAGNIESESKKVSAFELLLKAMPEKGTFSNPPNVYAIRPKKVLEAALKSLDAVIQRLLEERRMTEAEEVLQEMYHKGLTPLERTYTSLIRFFCQESRATKAEKVLREMIDRGFSPSLDTYNAVIQRNFYSLRIEAAMEILRDMPERDAVSYRHVICGLLFPPDKQLGKAFELKKDMDDKGILPDSVTYQSLIKNLCWEGRLWEAFHLFREMLHRGGFSPEDLTYFNLMNPYCLQGEFSKAFHLHDEVIHGGFLPDFVTGFSPSLVTYNALIYGYCSLGRVEEALEIFRGMPEMGLSPDTVSL